MAKRKLIDGEDILVVKEATNPQGKNAYAELACIRDFAVCMARDDDILRTAAPWVSGYALKVGYSRDKVKKFRQRLMFARSEEMSRKAISALELISSKYSEAPDKARAGSLITAAISEQFVVARQIDAGRSPDDIYEDAEVYAGDPINKVSRKSRNIDSVWLDNEKTAAGIYECKNDPNRLPREYKRKSYPGGEDEWRDSKLWLMLQLYCSLKKRGWAVDLAQVTLRRKTMFESSSDAPQQLRTVCVDDLLERRRPF